MEGEEGESYEYSDDALLPDSDIAGEAHSRDGSCGSGWVLLARTFRAFGDEGMKAGLECSVSGAGADEERR